jgi:transposase-like protein
MSENKRSYISTEEKVLAIKRHLLESVDVSEICDELDINVNLFYEWQNKLFNNGVEALSPSKESRAVKNKIAKLEAQITRKDQVVVELASELIDAKKKVGDL